MYCSQEAPTLQGTFFWPSPQKIRTTWIGNLRIVSNARVPVQCFLLICILVSPCYRTERMCFGKFFLVFFCFFSLGKLLLHFGEFECNTAHRELSWFWTFVIFNRFQGEDAPTCHREERTYRRTCLGKPIFVALARWYQMWPISSLYYDKSTSVNFLSSICFSDENNAMCPVKRRTRNMRHKVGDCKDFIWECLDLRTACG